MKALQTTLQVWLSHRNTREKLLMLACLYLLLFYLCIQPLLHRIQEQILITKQAIQVEEQTLLALQETLPLSPTQSPTQLQTQIHQAQAIHQRLKNEIAQFNSHFLSDTNFLNALNSLPILQSTLIEQDASSYTLSLRIQAPPFETLQALKPFETFIALKNLQSQDSSTSLTLHSQQILSLLQAPQDFDLQAFLNTPFNPPTFTPPPPTFKLEAILNQKAKINGFWVAKHQSFQGYTLQSIHPTSVILTSPTHTLELHLHPKGIFQ